MHFEVGWPDINMFLLSDNPLSGTLPSAFGHLPKLRRLHLARSQIGGMLPPSFVAGHALEDLQLSHTRLSGTLPSELGTLTAATHM